MIGAKIRARRTELNMSLRDLAERVGLTASFLSQIERDPADPPIKSLRKIATALRVPMLYFLDSDDVAMPVVRKDERKRLQLPHSKVAYALLTPDLNRKEDAAYDLEAGDSIYFDGPRLRALRAIGDEPAVFVSAMTPAVF